LPTVVILRLVAERSRPLSIDDPLYPQHGTGRDVRSWPLADISLWIAFLG